MSIAAAVQQRQRGEEREMQGLRSWVWEIVDSQQQQREKQILAAAAGRA